MLPPIVSKLPKVVVPTFTLVTLSTAATASPAVIPRIFASITLPSPLIGGLVTVQLEPLFVDSANVFVAVNALVDVPEIVCALLPVPVYQ